VVRAGRDRKEIEFLETVISGALICAMQAGTNLQFPLATGPVARDDTVRKISKSLLSDHYRRKFLVFPFR
jgi:hypothetical protein